MIYGDKPSWSLLHEQANGRGMNFRTRTYVLDIASGWLVRVVDETSVGDQTSCCFVPYATNPSDLRIKDRSTGR
jgi:hypothetical protein